MATTFDPSAVRAEMARKGFSVLGIAGITGLSPDTISRLLNGHSSPTVKTVDMIATAIGVDARIFWSDAPDAR